MQKNVLKHQFENFSTESTEGLDKAYDRFQKLISQLEVHGAPISKEDINQKFLRSLPSSWNQIALIMRNKPDIDEIDIDDLYNNLRVYEDELKELDLRWQVAMLTVRVKKFIQRIGRNMDFKASNTHKLLPILQPAPLIHNLIKQSTPPPTTKATNPQTALYFAIPVLSNNKSTNARLGATRDEFMNYLSASITARITEQVKNQLPQILPKEVSNFAPPVIQSMVTESLQHELKKILINKMDKSKSYLAAYEHRECCDRMIKSYDLDKSIFSTYGKVYSFKKSQKDKDKDVKILLLDQIKDSDMPQDQEGNLGNDDDEPMKETVSKRDWFTKPTQPQEPTDPDWNVGKTPQQGQTQSWFMTLASSADKPSKTFDELMSTPIDFSAYIMNGLKITNLTQETLLGPAFRLLKGTRSNYAELEYDFEECYKALSEKLDWENPEGGDYPFDLTKPLPLVMSGNRQKVLVDYFFNNDLKYLQGGVSTMTYTTSITKTKAAQYDLPGIEDMVPNIWVPVKVAYDKHALWGISHWREQRKTFYGYARGLESRHDVYSMKRILAVTQVEVMRKHGYGYLKEIVVRRADNDLYRFKEGDFPRLRINDIEDMLLLVVQN
ncbi:hypothetical protein Tco_0240565 [Tanacetum coccineum]